MAPSDSRPIPPTSPPKSADERPALETRIAQLLLVGFRGVDRASAAGVIGDISKRGLGGVVLFDVDGPSGQPHRNVVSADQVHALVTDLQAAVPQATGDGTPLIVAVDQEGGQVCRFKERHGFLPAASAHAMGRHGDVSQTRTQAAAIARSLAACGVNLNLAPVVDLNVNPRNPVIGQKERSFSDDPEVVAAHAAAFVRAHREMGVCCALKHFPGHGSSSADTHVGFTDVSESWTAIELRPFEQLIRDDLAAAVMTAHVFNAHLDARWPATLSRSVVTGLLRQRLGFDGVVISDDLAMGAIAGACGRPRALELALNAGVDLLCLCNQTAYEEDLVERTIDEIGTLVSSGKVSERRLDEAHTRIQRLKESMTARR